MRIFLLPISTRRTLIYCDRVQTQLKSAGVGAGGGGTTTSQPSIPDRIVRKANETWAEWENSETRWKKRLTVLGNEYVFSRIPFEEWGLKTLPSSTTDLQPTEVLYPDRFLKPAKAPAVLETIANDRQGLHRQRMWYSLIGLPFTIPVGLLPVIPNIPGFYLMFRAYSHYKALYGAKHLQALCQNNLVKLTPSKILNEMYASGLIHDSRDALRRAALPSAATTQEVAKIVQSQANGDSEHVMLLKRWNGKLLAEKFGLPGMELEIERAVEQVEKGIKVEADRKGEEAALAARAARSSQHNKEK